MSISNSTIETDSQTDTSLPSFNKIAPKAHLGNSAFCHQCPYHCLPTENTTIAAEKSPSFEFSVDNMIKHEHPHQHQYQDTQQIESEQVQNDNDNNALMNAEAKNVITSPGLTMLLKPEKWSFHITDPIWNVYKFIEPLSFTSTVWDIKVRLRHLENLPIEPWQQILVYKGRILEDSQILIETIVDYFGETKLYVFDRAGFGSNTDFKQTFQKCFNVMGFDSEMSEIALEATDYDFNDSLDILKNI